MRLLDLDREAAEILPAELRRRQRLPHFLRRGGDVDRIDDAGFVVAEVHCANSCGRWSSNLRRPAKAGTHSPPIQWWSQGHRRLAIQTPVTAYGSPPSAGSEHAVLDGYGRLSSRRHAIFIASNGITSGSPVSSRLFRLARIAGQPFAMSPITTAVGREAVVRQRELHELAERLEHERHPRRLFLARRFAELVMEGVGEPLRRIVIRARCLCRSPGRP